MDMMDIRRKVIAQANDSKYLKYWWCGDDAPIDSLWIDRISGFYFTIYGTNVWDSENKIYDFTNNNNYGMNDNPNSQNFNMGHHWRFDYDILINRSLCRNTCCFFDCGSIGEATKAIGFSVGSQSGTSRTRALINWKMQGNNSNPFPNDDTVTHSALPIVPYDSMVRVVGSYRLYDGDDGYDRMSYKINGIEEKYNSIRIPQVEYGPTWNMNRLRIGATAFAQRPTGNYKPYCKIKSIKIYVYD